MKRRFHWSYGIIFVLLQLALAILLLPVSTARGENAVSFADSNLESFVRGVINKPSGDIFPADLSLLTRLDAQSLNISDLSGLEYCTGLDYLNLRLNNVVDISPLENLTNLTYLNLYDNEIGNIEPLANLTNLTQLWLGFNQISDISALGDLSSLTYLSLDGNWEISDIASLQYLTDLNSLDLDRNQISDILPLVQNAGFGTGDFVDLKTNPLNQESLNAYIPALQTRGVNVLFTPYDPAPIITSFTGPVEPVTVYSPVSVQATFTDESILDYHIWEIDWGDSATTSGSTSGFSISGSHVYASPGVYSVSITVTDSLGCYGVREIADYIVIYDGDAGFVTGGGWIESPTGSCVSEPTLTGKASFGFVSKYINGIPSGQTEFQFKIAELNFHSESYQWLVVGGPKCMYKGTGTINGEGNFGFIIMAVDEQLTPSTSLDLFRIRIWDKSNDDLLVYDNEPGADDDSDPTTVVSGGNIIIHKD